LVSSALAAVATAVLSPESAGLRDPAPPPEEGLPGMNQTSPHIHKQPLFEFSNIYMIIIKPQFDDCLGYRYNRSNLGILAMRNG
jgi:hypothetical protein